MHKVKQLLAFWLPNFTCMACGAEIQASANAYLCPDCMQALPVVTDPDRTHFAPFYYAEPVRQMIIKLKYDHNGLVAKALAPYLAAVYLQFIKPRKKHLIVPVPLYRTRFRQRGYNQSLVLAEELAAYLDLPVVSNVLLRVKKTAVQKHMDAAARAANVKDAFAIAPDQAAVIKNQHILLLDDVYTTGATTHACARVLKQHGAKSVTILTLATVGA